MPQSPDSERYGSLKSFVRERGGRRLRLHPRKHVDRLVEIGVEEFWPECDRAGLAARMSNRVKQEYGFVLSSILIGVLVQFLAQLLIDWWRRRRSNQVLMAAWSYAAKNPDVSPKGG